MKDPIKECQKEVFHELYTHSTSRQSLFEHNGLSWGRGIFNNFCFKGKQLGPFFMTYNISNKHRLVYYFLQFFQ